MFVCVCVWEGAMVVVAVEWRLHIWKKNRKIYVQHENPFVRSEFCFATLISWFVVNVNDEVKMRLVSVSTYPIEIYMRNVV